ncbi:Co/Zn/Cd efflux system membrane fusion protein [Klebsiella pneumoniae]|uniref:Co/Zn/Cd efflux system membrane fusion protein n=1 Tax=Klebsiella pneumoniae TaxID=573 RepID=A0AB74GNU3_KLEPN|nr:Co/Zn/Cd efflux system membrane fusion protein [Klebsiella pneumoniae]
MWSSAFPKICSPPWISAIPPTVPSSGSIPCRGREFTAEYKEHTGSSDNSTLTWQIVLTMPRPDDFPAVGGVSGTVTVNLGNLPASAGRETLIVPAEAVFNPDNRPKNEPVVWVVKGDNAPSIS